MSINWASVTRGSQNSKIPQARWQTPTMLALEEAGVRDEGELELHCKTLSLGVNKPKVKANYF